MTSNSVALSTAVYDEAPRRYYLSADDAVGCYLQLWASSDCQGMDPERLMLSSQIQCTPNFDHHIETMAERHFLEDIFTTARSRCSAEWDHWVKVRVYREILRGFRGVSKNTVRRNVARVDALIEEQLAKHRRLIRSQVRGLPESAVAA